MQLEFKSVLHSAEAQRLGPRLDAWAAQVHAQFSDDPFPAGACARFLSEHPDDPETVLIVARRPGQDEPVGLCLCGAYEEPLGGERTPLILVLGVDPSVRHCGVARALVDEVRGVLATRGIRRLAARAGHNDDALISMGERWGFVRAWEWMVLD